MGALAGGLGSFPFDHGPYHPQSDSRLYLSGIRSLIEISTPRWGHHPFSALPPVDLTSRLALKLFRREPAISVFDWNFTPSHKSSAGVSTNVGSVLHWVVPQLQPDQGKITWLRVYVIILNALFRLAFATAPHLLLNLARYRNSPVHSTKGTPSPINGL